MEIASTKAVSRSDPLRLRFWDKVETSDGCWVWTGELADNGYGKFYPNQKRCRLAHRMAWELERGPITDDLCVLHHCDNRRCVRLTHLFLGTRRDNARDRDEKGRGVFFRGEDHSQCKLTEQQVLEIRERFGFVRLGQGRRPQGQPTNVQIAALYGVSHSLVSLILRREVWRHV